MSIGGSGGDSQVNWGAPAFFSGATQVLVAYWFKMTALSDAGPALYKTDFVNRGWWIFSENPNDRLVLATYPGASGNVMVASPIVGQGWIHTGWWWDGTSTPRVYRNGTGSDFLPGMNSGTLTYNAADLLSTFIRGTGQRIAELAIWARSDGVLTLSTPTT